MRDPICISIPPREWKLWCCRRPAGGKQQSTGLLHLIGSDPYPYLLPIKNTTLLGGVFYWQRMRDSNPRKRSQSPVCYRYTNPLSDGFIIRKKIQKSSMDFLFLQFFLDQSVSQGNGLPLRVVSFRYRKVSFSPRSRSIVRMNSSSCWILGCIRSRSTLFK